MEQQQCPICMLFLLPGMNLQDHLDTHPKDMIIKALLSVKTKSASEQLSKPLSLSSAATTATTTSPNEMATVFLTAPFNSSQTHIYQQSPPQLQQQQNTYAVAKRNSGNGNALLLGNRPYRLTLDSSQALSSPSAASTTATFLNASTSSSAVAPNTNGSGAYGRRVAATAAQVGDSDVFADASNKTAFRCIQNTEQKNIMIVNTSSTQFSIQQTVPVKAAKPLPHTATAIELHPVIIDNSSLPQLTAPNAISIIPRYTSEKYSGPPPSYESSVTNTINDSKRVIDLTLTQTPTMSTMKMMEKQQQQQQQHQHQPCNNSSSSNNNNSSNNTSKLTTLSGSGAEENRHLMITTPQKILEYTQTENGDYMITEKVLPMTTATAVTHNIDVDEVEEMEEEEEEEEVEEEDEDEEEGDEMVQEIHAADDDNAYNVKFVEISEPLTFSLSSQHASSGGGNGNGSNSNNHDDNHFTVIADEDSDVEQMSNNNNNKNNSSSNNLNSSNFTESQGSCSNYAPAKKKKSGVKVISNVKLTSAEMLSPTIKDIIKQYNSTTASASPIATTATTTNTTTNTTTITKNNKQTENEIHKIDQPVVDVHDDTESEGDEEEQAEEDEDEDDEEEEEEEEEEQMEEEEEEVKEVTSETTALIQCTETLNLSKEKEDMQTASVCTTSVIRKTNESPVPSTSRATEPEPEASTSAAIAECSRKNVVFNTNPTNRLKQKEIYKQPKKLVVKLKKPLVETGECSTSTAASGEPAIAAAKIKDEVVEREREVITTTNLNADMEVDEVQSAIRAADTPETSAQVCKVESSEEQFTVTFLDQHDYEPIKKITVTPELHHDSETNQSILSMDLEPETSVVKREQIESELPIIVKTEMNSCSASSLASHSQSGSCSRSSPGPSRQNIESVASTNESSPINFLYQNDRVRFSPPLSPYVYMKTFSSSEDQPKTEADASWNNSSSVVTQNSDQNSTCSRYTPSFDDNRSNYTDLDIKTSRNAQSTDSLNIRTDEKMPARGEISEQESNGEIEQPWHHPYFQLQAYPSSYDMNTAQECWNLSKADSQNACDSNNIQNVIINFPPITGQEDMKAPDLLKTIMQTVTKQEPSSINDEASGSNSNTIVKKNRSFRCQECSKVFVKLRARNRHMEQEHPHFRRVKKIKTAPTATLTSKSEASVFSAAASSSSALNWNAATITSQQEQEVKVLSIIKNEPSTSAAVLVKNEMNRMLISTTGSIKMEMDRLLLEPSTSSTPQQISTLGLKIKRTYMCAKCNEQFRTLKLLDKHFQIHPAECTLCQKTFNSWNTFSLHLKHHLNIRVHACRYCPKRFVQRQRLVEHERIHTGHMPIKCPDCDERFRRYSNMLHHRARVHLNKKAKQEDYVCDCGEIFQTKAKLEWHQETHENKPKPCPYCRERFTHRNSLTRHIRLSHTEKYVFVKSKAVNCPICNCTYLPSSIKAHMATHQLSNKEYSCTICSKQFSTKWNLKQHHWTHANRSSKPFQCNLCPSAFVRETDYTTHMNAHRSIKPFTCNTCGKRFVRKYNWLRHSREHEREKKFTCEICNKKFHRAYYLTEHKRVHTGERPFSCTICGKTSATKTNHNKHIKIHHARDPLTAEG